ncbi:MAG TPA: dTDP-4-dehydrorhamnose reductase [Thermoanaerobaculia bacterium]|nr:dTDP-4-dehydrorhamnose reductase [Thermoanaerobaculia bacterium]
MRTLIFGGTGMLGRALATEGRRRAWPVLALSHSEADLTDAARLLYWADAFRPQLVVNAAAFTGVDACETERDRAFAVNGRGVAHAVAAAGAAGARLLHVSTDYVFGGRADHPYREDAPTAPLSVYGQSKLEGEGHALAYGRALVVRTSWLFGPGGPNFAATMLGLIAAGKLPLKVVDDQVGCPTYTPYLARALADLAELSLTGLIHYRNREPVSWYAFAREIARLDPRAPAATEVVPVTTAEFPRPAPRPAYSVLDVKRFEAAAGRRVEPWEDGLAEFLAERAERARRDLRRT